MLGQLQAFKWQITTGLATVVAAALSLSLLVAKIENRSLTKQLDQTAKALSQARSNVITLEASIADQNAKIEQQGRVAAERLAAAESRLTQATVVRHEAERRAAALLRNPPKGDTLDARISDVDARIMEALDVH